TRITSIMEKYHSSCSSSQAVRMGWFSKRWILSCSLIIFQSFLIPCLHYISPDPLPQELQKQGLDLLVAAQLVQIGGKLLAVKGDLLGRGAEALVRLGAGLAPCGKDKLLICRGRRASADDALYSCLVELIPLDPAHLHKGPLGFRIIVGDEVGAWEIAFWDIVLQHRFMVW